MNPELFNPSREHFTAVFFRMMLASRAIQSKNDFYGETKTAEHFLL